MTLEDAKTISKGDYLCSPRSSAPFEPLRVTEVYASTSGRFVFVRLNGLAAVTMMAGGWCDARAFAFAPSGMKYNRWKHRYERVNKEKEVTATVTLDELRAQWVAGEQEGHHVR